MDGLMHRPPLCQILLLVLVVVSVSFVGQVSGRAARIIAGSVADEAMTETVDEHDTDDGDRKKRSVGSGATHSQFACPQQHSGVNYQCISQGSCQPHDVWQGALCGSQHQVCCRIAPQATSPTTSAGDSSGGIIDYYSLPEQFQSQVLTPEAIQTIRDYAHAYSSTKCGAKSPIPSTHCPHKGRIASGNEDAETCFAEWPWHVAILEKQRHKCSKPNLSDYDKWRLRCHIVHPSDLYRYICGGTLISPNHVLTAAHCVKGVRQDRLKLHLGDFDLYTSISSPRELLPEVQRSVLQAEIHEGYDPYTYEDDLAILTLNKPVELRLTPHISPVCLPTIHTEFSKDAHCTIVGWGEDPYKPNHGSNILKSVEVTIGTTDECEDKLGQSFTLGRHQICIVGSLGTDACLGDGGGAVVCNVNSEADFQQHYRGPVNAPDKYIAVGIISWGSESCGENSVTIINEIVPFIQWIKDKTDPRHQSYGYQQQTGYGAGGHVVPNPCTQNHFFLRFQSGGYGAISGQRMLLHDIVCVFGEGYTQHPNYKLWYDSVFGPPAGTGHGAGIITSPTGSCDENKFFIKVRDHGYTVIARALLSLEDIKCVFGGEDFAKNPNYSVWFDSVYGDNTIPSVTDAPPSTGGQGCEHNPFLAKVEAGGYGAITGMDLTLVDINCVFGAEYKSNPNYNVWFESVHGTEAPPSTGGQGCEHNPFLVKVEAGGYGAITGMDLTAEDINCVFGEGFKSNPNYKVWFESVHGTDVGKTSPSTSDSCNENKFLKKVEEHGYSAITGAVMTIEDIKCVFGEEFTTNPNYRPWFVSVFCGAGKPNPPGLCEGSGPGYSK